jgi:hypothetical protein
MEVDLILVCKNKMKLNHKSCEKKLVEWSEKP